MHNMPHTKAARAKMSAAHAGKPRPWRRAQQIRDGVVHFRCGRCGEFFPRELFHKSNRTSLGIKSDCKRCHSAVSMSTRDPDRTRSARRQSESTRRARKAGADGHVTAADWLRLLGILGDSCLCCGSDRPITQDHIVPLAHGGSHHPTNLQPLCRPCNERKQARTCDFRTDEQRAAVDAVWVVEFKRANGGGE